LYSDFAPFNPANLAEHTYALLSRITSSSIEFIFLVVQVEDLEHLDEMDWHTFAQSFARPQFARLRAVMLLIHGCIELQEVRSTFQEKLLEYGRHEIMVF
jgi:hypothetical protein